MLAKSRSTGDVDRVSYTVMPACWKHVKHSATVHVCARVYVCWLRVPDTHSKTPLPQRSYKYYWKTSNIHVGTFDWDAQLLRWYRPRNYRRVGKKLKREKKPLKVKLFKLSHFEVPNENEQRKRKNVVLHGTVTDGAAYCVYRWAFDESHWWIWFMHSIALGALK